MKKSILTFIFCMTVFFLSAQDYMINFQSKVDTVSIDSTNVHNLRTNQRVKLLGGESLLLVKSSTSINQIQNKAGKGFIYPNPTDGDAIFCISADKSEKVILSLFCDNGQLLVNENQNLTHGAHSFLLKFPAAGIYYLSLQRGESVSVYKAVYIGPNTSKSSVLYSGSGYIYPMVTSANELKSGTIDKSMLFTEGDVIQYTFYSGKN